MVTGASDAQAGAEQVTGVRAAWPEGASQRSVTGVSAVQGGVAVGDRSRVVDALIQWPEGALAVEVDGPHHFTTDARGGGGRPTGATRLRDAQLRRWGLRVLSLSGDATPTPGCSETAQLRLAALLRQHGVPLGHGVPLKPAVPHPLTSCSDLEAT